MNRKNYEGDISSKILEEGVEICLDFEKLQRIAQTESFVIPVVVQDVLTKEVLLIAYANEQALRHTLKTRNATFWSTSRNELWEKGLTSGDYLELVEVRVNCEQNSLLYLVKRIGKGACHTKEENGETRFGCYYRRVLDDRLIFIT